MIRKGQPENERKKFHLTTINSVEANSIKVIDIANLEEAIEGSHGQEWTMAVLKELEAHIENGKSLTIQSIGSQSVPDSFSRL